MIRPIYDQSWSKKFYEWLQPRANIEVDDYTTIGFLDEWDNIVGVILFYILSRFFWRRTT